MSDLWLRDQLSQVEDSLRQQTQKLSQQLLPSLNPEAVALALEYTGLSFLEPSLFEILQKERQDIEKRRQQLESQPDFQLSTVESQLLAEEEIKRIRDHQAALIPLIRICHTHPRFASLLKLGYGTSRYSTPFWRLSYYADHRAASELCRSTGKKDFAALLHDYQLALESYDTLDNRLKSLKTSDLPPRLQWEQLGKQLAQLQSTQLITQQTRIQLALYKGGPIWEQLKNSPLEPQLQQQVEVTGLLFDQLSQLRQQRAQGL